MSEKLLNEKELEEAIHYEVISPLFAERVGELIKAYEQVSRQQSGNSKLVQPPYLPVTMFAFHKIRQICENAKTVQESIASVATGKIDLQMISSNLQALKIDMDNLQNRLDGLLEEVESCFVDSDNDIE